MRYRLVYLACAVALLIVTLATSACANPLLGILGDSGASATTATPSPRTVLSGTSWTLTVLSDGETDYALAPTAPITLHFQRNDATYIGSSGCNYYDGAYTVSGAHLHLEFQSVTQKGCVGPIMSQEVAYLNTMRQVRSYQISDQTLTLKDGDNRVILVFTAS